MIVVCVDEIAEIQMASTTNQSQLLAEDALAEGTEQGVVVVEGLDLGDAAVREHCGRDAEVGHEQDERRDDGRQPGRPGRVGRLLGEVDGALPTPVDEDTEQEPRDEGREARHVEGREPRRLGRDRVGRPVVRVHLDQGDGCEDQQCRDLKERQHVLQTSGQLRTDHADRRHRGDDPYGEQGDSDLRAGGSVRADQHEEVPRSDVCEGANDEDPGRRHRPAADETGVGAHRAGHPGERCPGVRIGTVHVEERAGDQEHGDERGEHGRRGLHSDDDHERPEYRSQRVGGRRRRQADRQPVDEADRVRLQSLFLDRLLGRSRHARALHRTPSVRRVRGL